MLKAFRRALRPLFAAALLLALVAGPAALNAQFAQAAEVPKFTVAVDPNYVPMEFQDHDNQMYGYTVDYLQAMAEEAGFVVAWKKSSSLTLITQGICDFASCVLIIRERMNFECSDPYFELRQALVVLKQSSVTGLEQLHGQAIGVQRFSAAESELENNPKFKNNPDFKIIKFESMPEALQALLSGSVAGVVFDEMVFNEVVDSAGCADKVKIAFTFSQAEPQYLGFVVQKGNREVLDYLNRGIAAVKAKGIDVQLHKKWINPY